MVLRRKIFSPAKVNLILRIGPRRSDGYHDLETLMVPLDFGDVLKVSFRKSKEFKVKIYDQFLGIPMTQNLIYRAADEFFKLTGFTFDLVVSLKKNIPTGAGLGGGSSNAASILVFLAKQFGYSNKSAIQKIAKRLGADVPFFLENQAAWCTGIGEKKSPACVSSKPIVLVFSDRGVPTPWAYRTLDESRKGQGLGSNFGKGKPSWIENPDAQEVLELENDFEEIVLQKRPDLRAVQRALVESGAQGVRMSGSGATFFGVYSSFPAAKQAARLLARKHRLRAQPAKTLGSNRVSL